MESESPKFYKLFLSFQLNNSFCFVYSMKQSCLIYLFQSKLLICVLFSHIFRYWSISLIKLRTFIIFIDSSFYSINIPSTILANIDNCRFFTSVNTFREVQNNKAGTDAMNKWNKRTLRSRIDEGRVLMNGGVGKIHKI